MNSRHRLQLCITLFLILIRFQLPGARPDFESDPLGSLDQQFVIVLAMPEEGLRYGDPTKDLLANQRKMKDILIGTYPQCSHRLPTDEFGFAILTLNQSCPGDSISFVPISDKWRLASKGRVSTAPIQNRRDMSLSSSSAPSSSSPSSSSDEKRWPVRM